MGFDFPETPQMKKAKGKKGGSRTGKIRAHAPLPGMGRDPHASSEHHSANSAHGMPDGLGCKDMECQGDQEGNENGEMC